MRIGIIGGGASGLCAAIEASNDPSVQVVLFERQPRVGKKLSATGNGRCNLSNLNTSIDKYHGKDVNFCKYALEKYSVKNTLDWFKKLGLFTVAEPSGKVYPYSDQANSVVDILRFALDHPNITVLTDCEVKRIHQKGSEFIIEAKDKRVVCQKAIVACGGIAGTKVGGCDLGYRLLSGLGHKSTKLYPSLVQIKTSWRGIASLKGVRANCKAGIYCDGKLFKESSGEIQFTDYGVSGPVIFEISRDVCAANKKWECRLDLIPECDIDTLFNELIKRKESTLKTDDLLTGILHNRLGRVVCKEANIPNGVSISDISDSALKTLAKTVKKFSIPLTEPMGMDMAQVTAGGVLTDEFDPHTMESKIVKGLYACGEVLDIDGDCGGYNLQWAWSSGRLAGASAKGGNK